MIDDRTSVISKLREYLDQIEAICKHLNAASGADRGVLRRMLAELKAKLAQGAKELDRRDWAGELTTAERQYLLPAVVNAKAKMKVTVNSVPNQRRVDGPGVAQMEFEYFLGPLE